MRKPYPTDLSDAEWKYIEPHMPVPKGHGRPRTHSLRGILDAIFYLLKSGCQWRLRMRLRMRAHRQVGVAVALPRSYALCVPGPDTEARI